MATSQSKSAVNVSAFIRAQPITLPAAEVLKKLKAQHNIVKKPDLVWSVRKEMRKKGHRKTQVGAPRSNGGGTPSATQDVARMVRNVVFRYGYEAVTRELEKLKRELS